jgi:hypothetical protein
MGEAAEGLVKLVVAYHEARQQERLWEQRAKELAAQIVAQVPPRTRIEVPEHGLVATVAQRYVSSQDVDRIVGEAIVRELPREKLYLLLYAAREFDLAALSEDEELHQLVEEATTTELGAPYVRVAALRRGALPTELPPEQAETAEEPAQ